MKRAPLKRKTSLNRVSQKQQIELAKRRLLKYQLWLNQNGRCAKCGRLLKFGESELSHKKSLARGGKTEAENCEVLCASWLSGCHSNIEHGRNNKYNESPIWTKEA